MTKKKDINHSERAHALLSPSGASRWMSCTPSARFEEQFPKKPSSVYAEEGTLAHEFAEVNLRQRAGLMSAKDLKKELEKLRAHDLYTDEMEEEVDKYVLVVMEDYLSSKLEAEMMGTGSAEIFIEQRFSLEEWIEGGFGSNDSSVVSYRKLTIHDLKYGKGVPVYADNNSQLKLYALGAFSQLPEHRQLEIEEIELVIVQPRLDVVSRWSITPEELMNWAETEVKNKAQLAYSGKGDFVAGDHCKWCRAKAKCKAIYEFSVGTAQLEFAENDDPEQKTSPNMVDDEKLLLIYKHSKIISDWVKEVGDHLLTRALNGEKFEGYKLVRGQTRRKIADETSVLENLEMMGFPKEDVTKTKIKGIGELEKILGTSFDELVTPFITKSQNAPSLVQSIVNRESFDPADSAKSDFKD